MGKDRTCADRIREHHESRMAEYLAWRNEEDEEKRDELDEETEPLGISAGITIRVELSTGGPGDWYELTFDNDGENTGGTYHFNDWFDHAEEPMREEELDAVLVRFGFDDPSIVKGYAKCGE